MATYPIKMLRDEDRQPFVPFTSATAVVDSNNVTLQELMTNGKYKIQNNVTTSSAGKGVLDAYQGKVLNDKFSNYVPLSQKGVANGVATLDGDAKVPTAQLPSYVDDVIEAYTRSGATALSSTWLSLTDGGAALTPEKGKIYIIMSSGSYQNKQYRWSGSTYVLCNPSDVNSVNGFTGVVVLKELTIQKNGTQVGDKFNGSANKTINIAVPTKTSDITNDSGFITAADDITGTAAMAVGDKNGDDITTTYVKKAGDTMTGALTTPSITLNNSNAVDHIALGRGNYNYIRATNSNGKIAFIVAGKGGGSTAQADLIIENGVIRRGSEFTTADIGTSAYPWRNVYATNFKGNADTATSATQDGSGNVITDTYVKKAGDAMTGDLMLSAAAATDSPSLIFQRGTLTDNYNDWKINDRGGTLYFDQRGNGSSSWSNIASIDTSGKVTASTFVGSLQGNANTATKATGDKNGLDITNYIKGLSISGKVITYTKGDDTTGTITTQDTVYTLPVAGTGVNGVLGGIRVGSGLIIDSGTGVLSATGGGTADSVEWSGVLNKPTNVSYWNNDSGYITLANVMAGATASTAGAAGVVPAPGSGSQAKFLRGDGQWATVDYATLAATVTVGSGSSDSDRNIVVTNGSNGLFYVNGLTANYASGLVKTKGLTVTTNLLTSPKNNLMYENEFNFTGASYNRDNVHFNYRGGDYNNTSTKITKYYFDDGQKNGQTGVTVFSDIFQGNRLNLTAASYITYNVTDKTIEFNFV